MKVPCIIAIFLLYMIIGIFIDSYTQPNDPPDLSLILLWPFAFIFIVGFIVINSSYSVKDKVVERVRKIRKDSHD